MNEEVKMEDEWIRIRGQRDEEGNLTPLALAIDSIAGNGCDCGNDEPGTCLACLCEEALKDLWKKGRNNRGC